MTKSFHKYFLCILAGLSIAACQGKIDPEDSKENVPEGVLRIFADKTSISADGNEEVTFTIMYGSEDVSNEKTLRLVRTFDGNEKYMPYGVNKFSTVTAGTYTFRAQFYYGGNKVSDNEIQIVAEPYFTGEEKNYERRFLGTLFTSTGCNSCPLAAAGLKSLQEENPGIISVAAFHSDMSSSLRDPMTISDTDDFRAALGGFTGLPSFFWNLRKDSYFGGAHFGDGFEKEKAAYETYCGVAIATEYDESASKLDITVGITSNKPSVLRYLVLLVEDNIPAMGDYAQNGQAAEYVHHNVVRKALTGPSGDKINDNLPFTIGVESKASKSYTLDAGWKAENMRVIVAAMSSEDGGINWTANNTNECRIGESVSYIYAE